MNMYQTSTFSGVPALVPLAPMADLCQTIMKTNSEATKICVGSLTAANREWLHFLNSRGLENAQFASRMMKCKSSGDTLAAIADHSREVFTAYQNEWSRMFKIGVSASQDLARVITTEVPGAEEVSPSI